ncbi:urinary protein 2 [Kryptolebias marmoratus]|uniref:Urinary protein 2-like n=1 Tax=Kryptolebias marmoratus TaxID=37003 RepID=A0A3Q3GM13_KRYMA|nr:urinary protein 2 [Kryptolebias marmoratus]
MLLSFVALSLLFSPATSLQCYVCSSSATNAECNQGSQECQSPHDTCMTIVDTLGDMMAIVKQCSSKATCNGASSTASVDSNGNGNTVRCCSGYNYCNYSGAGSVHTHPTLLLLTAGLLLLLAH